MSDRPVIAIGEILIDLIAPAGESLLQATDLRIREGGAPANVAVALSRLGVPAQMRAVVGDDPFGERLVNRLRAEGVRKPETQAGERDGGCDGERKPPHHSTQQLRLRQTR